MFLGGLPDSLNIQLGAGETLCSHKKGELCHHYSNVGYREALSMARKNQYFKHHHHHLQNSFSHPNPPLDFSTDAIIYVGVVVVFYAAIIILLLTTNFRRKRNSSAANTSSTTTATTSSSDDTNSTEASSENVSEGTLGRHPKAKKLARKHWLFFNPRSGMAQQANRKESHFLMQNQDAETV